VCNETTCDRNTAVFGSTDQGSSVRTERTVRFEPNVRSERVRYFSVRETNVQAFKRSIFGGPRNFTPWRGNMLIAAEYRETSHSVSADYMTLCTTPLKYAVDGMYHDVG